MKKITSIEYGKGENGDQYETVENYEYDPEDIEELKKRSADPDLLTVSTLSALSGLSRSYIYRLIDSHKLSFHISASGKLLISQLSYRNFIASRRSPGRPPKNKI